MIDFYNPGLKILLLILVFSKGFFANAQNTAPLSTRLYPIQTVHTNIKSSPTDALMNEWRKSPRNRAQENKINQQILSVNQALVSGPFLLPVVFHIINPYPLLLTDAQILAAVQDLNDAFSKQGVYAGSTGADTKIQFCLARKDPDGGNTTGITRTSSGLGLNVNAFIGDDGLKNLIRWDPSKYINIWVITSLNTENMTIFNCGNWNRLGEGGYAKFPGGDPLKDGIVVTGFGQLLAHEMGHYLSLYHTFEGLNCVNNDCTTDGDQVCDTPPDNSVFDSPSCSNPQNSCSSDTLSNHSDRFFPVDVPDMISNFMDYGNLPCHNAFTEGQSARMRAAIATQRSGLLQDECNKPCTENSGAGFTRDNANPTPGTIINFTNTATGATQFSWLINDVVSSSGNNFSTSFPAAGVYKVTLKAYNADASCYAAYTDYVIVNCGVIANFYSDKRVIASKSPLSVDSIYFTNTSFGATSYQWLLDAGNGTGEQLVSASTDLKYIFLTPGNYTLRLVATKGGCSDTTEYYTIPVQDPTQDGLLVFNDVECYQGNKIRALIQVHNGGYATIPKNIPVSFYDADPAGGKANKLGNSFYLPDSIPGNCWSSSYVFVLTINTPGLNQLYAVFNDSGTTHPFSLPGTSMQETDYFNNTAFQNNFQFKLTAAPPTAILQPGDTLQLGESTIHGSGSGVTTSYVWSPADALNCTNCPDPFYVAGYQISTITKKVIGTTNYGCMDSSFLVIKIPAYDDFKLRIDSMECAETNHAQVNFTICDLFVRGFIPKGLMVSFYNGDPSVADAHLLGPVFIVPANTAGPCASFHTSIQDVQPGNIYAVVNVAENQIPVVFPQDSLFVETDYSNNGTVFAYQPATVSLLPSDTTVYRNQSFPLIIRSSVPDPSAASWFNGNGYTLSCNSCSTPAITVLDSSIVKMQIANQYGCVLKGQSVVNVFPPDFTIQLLETSCYTNTTTKVKFMLCMNNYYDNIYANLPVTFYDGDPSTGTPHPLQPVFYTTNASVSGCDSFTFIVNSPLKTNNLFAVVNDQGNNNALIPSKPFNETDDSNNSDHQAIIPFAAFITPADTTILRFSGVQVSGAVSGGQLTHFDWLPQQFLSCSSCLTPVITPPYSMQYAFVVQNENQCVDTAYTNIKTFAAGLVDIPNAFTPNGDGRNDVFYILGTRNIQIVKGFSIFNRLGQKVFEKSNVPANDPGYGWTGFTDGHAAPAGAYVYVISIQFENGTLQLFKGTVVLVR